MLGWLHPFFSLLNKEQKKHSNYHYEHVDHAHNCTFSSEKDVKVNRVQSNIGYQRDGSQPDQCSGEAISPSFQKSPFHIKPVVCFDFIFFCVSGENFYAHTLVTKRY